MSTKRKDQNGIIEASNTINNFLNLFHSKGTKYTYKSHLKRFFNFLNVDPDKYFDNGRNYKKDVLNFYNTLTNDTPHSQDGAMACIKVFLMENDIEFKQKFWRNIRRRRNGKGSVTVDKIPTQSELKQILNHGELKAKALFLTMASSGMRIGEIVKLTKDDIDLTTTPATIHIPYNITKNGMKRTTFMSNESRDAIKQWLKPVENIDDNGNKHKESPRDYYIKCAIAKCNIPSRKPVNDDRIFPFSSVNARRIWNRLLKQSGFNTVDKRSGYHNLHPHCLRKFFRSQLSTEIKVDVIEALLGHEGYLTAEYRKVSDNVLGEEYEKGINNLLIFETPSDTTAIIKKQQLEIEDLKDKVETLMKHYKEIVGNGNSTPTTTFFLSLSLF